ncbi:MAG: 2-phospho-L-lactate transferase [Actinobacteria bacterium]|nr:2-phospho-L-lactate transferase [Actinomycetota bacterium]
MITVLAGGVGAARLLSGLVRTQRGDDITAIVNVGDDLELYGLHISPDLDTVTYTLAERIDPGRGWGLADETWHAMATLGELGGPDWFNLGDRDLGTHLYRTGRLHEGATLAEVTAEITNALGVDVRIVPATNDRLRTKVSVMDPGLGGPSHEIDFQRYFVERAHSVPITGVRFQGAEAATPAPGVLDAIGQAERVVIAPSNPIVSIAPVLAVPGIRQAVTERRDDVVAVSPIVAGAALKGPADRMLDELGLESSVVGIARWYTSLAATLVIDRADAALAGAVEAEGMRCVVTDTVMSTPDVAGTLGATVLAGHTT